MTIDEKTLRMLEFPKIRDQVVALATFGLGKELASALEPLGDVVDVRRAQEETSEAVAYLWRRGEPPFGGLHDIRRAVARAAAGAALDTDELLQVRDTADCVGRLRTSLLKAEGELPGVGETLAEVAERLVPMPGLVQEISRCLDDDGLVKDTASPKLRGIRQAIRTAQARVRERLDSLVRSSDKQRFLQDAIVTLRNGRYVVPVKLEYRGQVPGIIHDQSASGATVFVEPIAVVELNNELRRLETDEEDEVARILQALSAEVGGRAEPLGASVESAGRLDFAFAKAKLSKKQDASAPLINGDARLRLRRARHPLLTGEVVPIDVELGESFRTLVITGPNTGGKTVTLKTVGLLALMTLAGLHIPVAEGSEMGLFMRVFADIGDEQSIEQSLSTFSSHMTNIVRILRGVEDGDLVLLDELGAGTDPTEGAALAMAILDELHRRGARTVATTHYSELKSYAYTNDGVQNASVEFDVATLKPTYRLMIGMPGSSNAFAIAERLGLSANVVGQARALVDEDKARIEDLIRSIEESEKEAKQGRAESLQALKRARQAEGAVLKLLEDAAQSRAKIVASAREEARSVVAQARREAEEVMKKLRQLEREREAALAAAPAIADAKTGLPARQLTGVPRNDLRGEGTGEAPASQPVTLDETLRALRGQLRRVADELESGREPAGAGPAGGWGAAGSKLAVRLKAGQKVRLTRYGQTGFVLEPPKDGAAAAPEVLVQVGVLKLTVPVAEVEPITEGQAALTGVTSASGVAGVSGLDAGQRFAAEMQGAGRLGREKSASISVELDLRGTRADEALAAVDKYIDDALLAGVPMVRLIHGKGTGALRRAIQDFLGERSQVLKYRNGSPEEGGEGVTVVTFG